MDVETAPLVCCRFRSAFAAVTFVLIRKLMVRIDPP
jgi:hypothetical protein